MKSFFLLTCLLSPALLLAEPSAFGAGSLESSNPYGLSESEKSIIENRQRSLKNQKLLRQQSLKIEQLQETIEGLRSVVESISSKIGKTGQRLSEMSAQSGQASSDELAALQAQIDTLKTQNQAQYKKIDKALKGMSKAFDAPVTKHTPKKATPKKAVKKPKKQVIQSNGQLIKSAISDYRAKRYTSAKKTFTVLAEKNYKPAQTNYYLGEIAYYRKNYDEAIYHFKTSVGYYDQASYMPTLLLHTALSFKALGDQDNAQRFFDTILATYPESAQANIAQKYLN